MIDNIKFLKSELLDDSLVVYVMIRSKIGIPHIVCFKYNEETDVSKLPTRQ